MEEIRFPVTLQPQTFTAVFSYLATRPWNEVHQLIVSLAASANASVPEPPKPPRKKAT